MPTEWSRLDTWAVSTWRVFEPDQDYGLIYPLHESCLDIIRQIGLRRSLQVENGSRIPSGLGDCFEALLRLHVRNTTTPNGRDIYPGCTANGLEWEHYCYGAREMWMGPWGVERGWEVSGRSAWSCLHCYALKG